LIGEDLQILFLFYALEWYWGFDTTVKRKQMPHGVFIIGNACKLKINYLRHSEINWNLIGSESQSKRDFFSHFIPLELISAL
jgi:hypothetical protein